MATKKSSVKSKPAKDKLLEEHISNLDRRIWNVQDEMIQMGIDIVSEWLSDADRKNIFNKSVDWLLGSEAKEMFESQSGVMAIESVKHAIYQFETNEEDNFDEEGDEEKTNASNLYENVRTFFNV